MKRYETVVIFDSALEETRMNEILEDMERRIRAGGGEVQARNVWGKRKLAYPIKKKENGVYAHLQYDAPGAAVAELERTLRLDERVLRHMTVVGPEEALVRAAAQAAERAAQRRSRVREEED